MGKYTYNENDFCSEKDAQFQSSLFIANCTQKLFRLNNLSISRQIYVKNKHMASPTQKSEEHSMRHSRCPLLHVLSLLVSEIYLKLDFLSLCFFLSSFLSFSFYYFLKDMFPFLL